MTTPRCGATSRRSSRSPPPAAERSSSSARCRCRPGDAPASHLRRVRPRVRPTARPRVKPRVRTSGTLERLMTTPIGKGDFLFGYALAFTLMAALQAAVLTAWAHWVCGMDVAGSLWALGGVGVLDAVLGSSLGLAASSVARTEFQAVQMMPVVVVPQILLCGIVMPRSAMPAPLEWLSDAAPLTYAVEATSDIAAGRGWAQAGPDIALMAAFTVAVLGFGVLTLRRRTP
ncbi:MAG: ABC transporter permease [Bifidobacteriaceae bacterium]|nr:ABC transporter permease [Bifidobacteriaceae bacterium]